MPLTELIIKGQYAFPDEFWADISDQVKDLIRQMMCIDPLKRLSIDEVLQHPWLAADIENTRRVDEFLIPSEHTSLDDESVDCKTKKLKR
jgi:serine/threonine protein kinase